VTRPLRLVPALPAGPRPYDAVWTFRDVDHDVVPGETVTRCGREIDAPFVLNHPRGATCSTCFDLPEEGR
jgi:hypothetical protein